MNAILTDAVRRLRAEVGPPPSRGQVQFLQQAECGELALVDNGEPVISLMSPRPPPAVGSHEQNQQ
jgi:hypothetical protein